MGGGTTVVESLASGRLCVGSDINELSHFVTRVKTTPLSTQDFSEVQAWADNLRKLQSQDFRGGKSNLTTVKNMPEELVPFFETATILADGLTFPRRQLFARCALARVGQWALDSRRTIPSATECCDELESRLQKMVQGLSDLVESARGMGVEKNKLTGRRWLRVSAAENPQMAKSLARKNIRPKLVLTSPPYPGVHVLYHRWQVKGRRETPAPYWISGLRDGHGGSYYTMGGRSVQGLRSYFETVSRSFRNLRALIDKNAYVVQLVSFSNSYEQLPLYLEALKLAGLEEESANAIASRQVRVVPNRKWYNSRRQHTDASRELLLVHRIKT